MQLLSKFKSKEDGSSTIEFVILFPVIMTIFLSAVEAGMLMLRNVWLERGVDMAVRELRLGINVPADEGELVTRICNHAGFIRNCDQLMRIEMVRLDTSTFVMPSSGSTCVASDKLTQPVLEYTQGAGHDLMLIRACAIFDPYFPFTGLGLQMPRMATGEYALTAASAFLVEPS